MLGERLREASGLRQRYWFMAGLAVVFTLSLGGLATRLAGLSAAGESVFWLVLPICGVALTGAGLAVLADRFIRYGSLQGASAGPTGIDWQKVVEAAPVALALYDADRGLVSGNGPWRALFKEARGPARDLPGEQKLSDGSWFRLDEAPLDGGGRLVAAVDTTGLHRQADLAREEMEKSRLVLSATGAWIWETDVLHRFSTASPLRAGLSEEDLQWMIGHDPAELAVSADDDSGAALSACIRDMDRRHDLQDAKLVLRHGTGFSAMRLNGVPRTGGDGAFLGYCGVGVFESVYPTALPDSVPELPPSPGEPPAGLGRRILLVDDSRTNRMLGLSILKKMGYEADAVESGLEAIDAVGGCDYGVVLMDIWMPGMDGFETTAEIRRLPEPASAIPVVAMTAHVGSAERRRCFESGMIDHVSKPVDRRILSAVLQRVIGPAQDRDAEEIGKPEPVQVAPGAVLVDSATLEQMRIDVGPENIGEYVAEFMAETNERVLNMRGALESGDLKTVAYEAHAMKSTTGTYGAFRLQKLIKKLDSAAKEDKRDLVSRILDDLPALVVDTWREFERAGYPPP